MNNRITVQFTEEAAFQLLAAPHNLQFVSAERHTGFCFKVVHTPYKRILEAITAPNLHHFCLVPWTDANESGRRMPDEPHDVGVMLFANIGEKETRMIVEICYSTKTWTSPTSYQVEQHKIQFFDVSAEREQIAIIVEPYLSEAYRFNKSKVTAANMIRYFKEWAHPPKLEDVIASLTEEQKEAAAKLLKKRFAA